MGLSKVRTQSKRLWLIRHSEAENNPFKGRDLDRNLTQQGSQNSVKMRSWLNTLSHQPALFWVSAANRTIQTAKLLSKNTSARLIIEEALYLATAEELLDILHYSPEEQPNIAIVAHNPGISDLVNSLCNTYQLEALPPSGIAYFKLDCKWSEVSANKQYSVTSIFPGSCTKSLN